MILGVEVLFSYPARFPGVFSVLVAFLPSLWLSVPCTGVLSFLGGGFGVSLTSSMTSTVVSACTGSTAPIFCCSGPLDLLVVLELLVLVVFVLSVDPGASISISMTLSSDIRIGVCWT